MRYLVTARVKAGQREALDRAIEDESLGRGSVAGDEYLRNMTAARQLDDGRVQWVEVCYCATPLAEERDYWEVYFALDKVQDAHARSRCRDLNGTEPWACGDCDCTARLEAHLAAQGPPVPSIRLSPSPEPVRFILAACRRLPCRRCWRAPAPRSSAAAAPRRRRCSRRRCARR